jgi:hypothetical protein
VAQDAAEVSSKAADFGTAVHHAIEDWFNGDELTEAVGPKVIYGEYDVSAQLDAYIKWHDVNIAMVLEVEQPFCNAFNGYGGKRDIKCLDKEGNELFIDIKTTKTKPGVKVTGYQEQGMQLAAYSPTPGVRLLNVFLSSTEPGRLEVVEWTDQRDNLFDGFLKTLDLWKWLKNYDPVAEAV